MKNEHAQNMELIHQILLRTLGEETVRGLKGRNVESVIQYLASEAQKAREETVEIKGQFPKLLQANKSLSDALEELRFFSGLETTAWVVDRIDESVKMFFDVVKKCVNYEEIVLYRTDMKNHAFACVETGNVSVGFRRAVENVIDTGMFAWVLRGDDPLLLSVSGFDLGYEDFSRDVLTLALMPMVVLKEPVGVVCLVYKKNPEDTSPDFLHLLKTLVKHFAVYFQRLGELEALRAEMRRAAESREFTDSVIHGIGQGIFVLDQAGRVSLMNQTAEIIFGVDAVKFLGKTLEEAFPGELSEIFLRLQKAALSGDAVFDYELEHINEKGACFSLGVSCGVLRDAAGVIAGCVFQFRDLFTRRELMRLRELDQSQSEKIERANRNLECIRGQLAQSDKLASVGHMAAGIAHEINNPLGIISGYIQIAMMDLPEEQQEKYRLKVVHEELHRIKKIVRKLLDFSRQDTTTPHDWAEAVNLNSLIRHTVELMSQEAQLHKVKFIVNLASDLPRTCANEDQIKQVLMNVVLNAIQAMPDGGEVSITSEVTAVDAATAVVLESRPARLERGEGWVPTEKPEFSDAQGAGVSSRSVPQVKAGDPVILVKIRDTGTGIREEDQRRIFDPFFTTKPQGEGTGLGLSTCYGIMEKHGGRIWGDSEWGRGSTFTLAFFPMMESE